MTSTTTSRVAKRAGRPLSWLPVKHGATYCSPACGHGCTYKDHQLAQKRAQALADKLNNGWIGEGWKPRVWENFGWHYEVVKGIAKVIGHNPTVGKPYYLLFLDAEGQQLYVGQGPAPVSLVRRGLFAATKKVDLWKQQLMEVVS